MAQFPRGHFPPPSPVRARAAGGRGSGRALARNSTVALAGAGGAVAARGAGWGAGCGERAAALRRGTGRVGGSGRVMERLGVSLRVRPGGASGPFRRYGPPRPPGDRAAARGGERVRGGKALPRSLKRRAGLGWAGWGGKSAAGAGRGRFPDLCGLFPEGRYRFWKKSQTTK